MIHSCGSAATAVCQSRDSTGVLKLYKPTQLFRGFGICLASSGWRKLNSGRSYREIDLGIWECSVGQQLDQQKCLLLILVPMTDSWGHVSVARAASQQVCLTEMQLTGWNGAKVLSLLAMP